MLIVLANTPLTDRVFVVDASSGDFVHTWPGVDSVFARHDQINGASLALPVL